ncbi:MAG: MBL fold metallo-hydrolase [Gemmatimonadaceae bacterium]
MAHFICTACGAQFAELADAPDTPPLVCPICTDERQFVPESGQQWTTLTALRRTHRNSFQRHEPGLYGVGTFPAFAIGQRALLVEAGASAPSGRRYVLWDCIALLDDATRDLIGALGGLAAVAVSHPHFYTTVVEWARAFDCPVYLHAADRAWVMRPDPAIRFWDGGTHNLADAGAPGLTLVHCGGHFAGSTVLHWAAGADGRGALLTGDTLQVTLDRRHVGFLRSYPNYFAIGADAVRRVGAAVAPFAFDRIYGAWWDQHIDGDARAAVARSVERAVAHLGEHRKSDEVAV